jgi:hypothetical protein
MAAQSPFELRPIDHSTLRTNQAFIIGLSLLTFILDLPWLTAIVAGVMLLGTLLKRPGFGVFYVVFLMPLGIVRPNILQDNPEPHRFAQGFGGVVLLAASAALFASVTALGWILVWLVVALAALNLFGGFCVGCAMYYWLSRKKIPGFEKSPPAGRLPGMRPRANQQLETK